MGNQPLYAMMKYLFAAALTLTLFACDNSAAAEDIPAAVTAAFNAAYPGATDVEWEHEGDEYEVEFDFKGEEFEIKYDMAGNVLEMEED